MSSCDIEVPKTKRSMRTTPPVYAPSFVIMHGNKFRDQTFCIPFDRTRHRKSVPELRGMSCLASCYGWLMLQNCYSGECHLFNPTTLTKIQLPMLSVDANFSFAVITSPPDEQTCVVMVFSNAKNSCCFCRIGDTTWTKRNLEHKRKNDLVIQDIRNAVSSNGKIYMFFYEGMAVIDVQDPFARIETYERKVPKHLICINTFHSSHLIESCGEIFYVLKVFLGMSEIVEKFIVFKLELSTMTWMKVESLGDTIFLLSPSSNAVSLSSAEFGTKGNCIYFFPSLKTDLCCFDMEDGTILTTQPCPSRFSAWDGLYWVVPSWERQVQKEVAEVTEEVQVNNSVIPADILHMVFQSLFLSDSIRFRLACKSFISMTPRERSFHVIQTLPYSQHLPWLISFPNKEEICHLYHPIYTDSYIMNLPRVAGAVVRDAKFGWLLMSVGDNFFFFFNPFTTETIKLPYYPYCDFINVSFSSPPTSIDCVVFGHLLCGMSFVCMSVYRKSENRWRSHFLTDLPYTFVPSLCNAVFHGGVFYCLSKDGKLGIYNPNESNEEEMWRVYTNLSVPDVTFLCPTFHFRINTRSFIMECDGQIFCVFVGYASQVSVYKLDRSKAVMKWIKVENLGNKVMFLSHKTSLLVPAELKGRENRIYFPRFKKKASLYYCLRSGKYHSFGDENSQANWIETIEHWNCTWFQIPCSSSNHNQSQ